MAHKIILPGTYQGLPFLWNVTATVGARQACVNSPTDVRLAKLLLKLVLDGGLGRADTTPSVLFPPPVDDAFDHGLGFWIYHNQDLVNNNPDGIISSAPKYPSTGYMIVRLNGAARDVNPTAWENLPEHPLCGPMLKAELMMPPR